MNDESLAPLTPPPAGLPSVGDLLRSSLERYKEHWKLWVAIVLPAALVGGLYAYLMPTPAPGLPAEPVDAPGMILLSLVLAIVQFVSTLALLTAVREPVSVGEAYRRGAKFLFPYLFVGILSGIIIGGGFLLFIIPGVLFALWFGLAPYILISENTRGMDALLKSKAYVSGHVLSVLGRVLVLLLVAIVASAVLSILPEPVPTVLITFFLVPFATIYCFKIYEGLRAIKGTVPDTYPTREKALYLVIGLLGIIVFVGLIAFGVAAFFLNLPRPM